MSYSTDPALDAARHYEPLFAEAETTARTAADDVAAARAAVAAIHAIPQYAITAAVAAQLCAAVSALVARSGWSHVELAEQAQGWLDDASDSLAHDFLA
ncbi:MAG: hypothetical protein ABIR26_17505 [Ramlibacter sp.]